MLEDLALPYAVALNEFPDAPVYGLTQLREAMDLSPDTPLVSCDARDRAGSKEALIQLVQYLLTLSPEPA